MTLAALKIVPDIILNKVALDTEPSNPVEGDVYLDDGTNTASGTPGFRLYTSGAWEDLGGGSSGSTLPVDDTTSIVQDPVDNTKQMRIDVGGVTTGTVRVATMPDADLTLVGTDTAQTLSNKTLTTPTIGSFTNALHNHTDIASGGTLPASAIASGTLAHERGGLEVDASAFSGLIKIQGGLTSAVAAPSGTVVGTTDTQTLSGKTLTTPTIGDFTNAAHNHSDAAGGGTIDASVITYTPTTLTDWNTDTDPGDVDNALDQLAERVDDLEGAGGGGLYTSVAILRDEKSTGTAGGSSSAATWNNRNLNTEVYDPDAIVTISSNQFTPIAGDYEIDVTAPAYKVNFHRLRLYNVTGAASVDEGGSALAHSTDATASHARLVTKFTANGTDAYRIDHYTNAAQATNGLGFATSDGSNEIYLEITLRKLS